MFTWTLTIGFLLLISFALLAPLESLRWWSTRGELETRRTFEKVGRQQPKPPGGKLPSHFVVYLSGVNVVEGNRLSEREQAILGEVAAQVPEISIITDVFPYSVENRGLLQRATSSVWSLLVSLRADRNAKVAPLIINLRNVFQVMVSADPRYGPTYNAGVAQQIWRSLEAHGYRPGCGVPVTLIGYSGGTQVALGAATLLSLLGTKVSVISIGGVFGDDPGLDHVNHLWDIRGRKDWPRLAGPIAFPGRWPIMRGSAWHRALRDGRVTVVDAGPVDHDGRDSYFDADKELPGGGTAAQKLVIIMADLLRQTARPTRR